MQDDLDLFGKTFDQQLAATAGKIEGRSIAPNRRIQGEIVLEPTGYGVRVTARDASHQVLWGFIASKETLRQIHCLVATYETLHTLIAEELGHGGLSDVQGADPIARAEGELQALTATHDWLQESVKVERVTDAARARAAAIARIVADANRQIVLEASTLSGMKPKRD